MTSLLLTAALCLTALLALVRRAPLPVMFCVGLLGLAGHAGLIRAPSALSTPVAGLSADVHAWQARDAAAIGCELGSASCGR